MAISFKSLNGIAALKKLGVDGALLKTLEATGSEVKLTAVEFRFSHPDFDTTGTVPVVLDDLQQLNAGTLAPAKAAKLRSLLNDVLTKFLLNIGPDAKPSEATVGIGALPKLATKPFDPVLTMKVPAQKAAVETTTGEEYAPGLSWKPFPVLQMKTATPVPLVNATRMYQPVFGTSKGSRYFLVAGRKDLKVAARYDNMKLSVRIEGPGLSKWADRMIACGFELAGVGAKHTSMHLDVSDPVIAAKALGAILLGLNIEMETPMPMLSVIK